MENWIDVIGYEGLYMVSDMGNVKSVPRTFNCINGQVRYIDGRVLKLTTDKLGYKYITLYIPHVSKSTKSVHRIVYESFKGKTDLIIDHIIEGNPSDNRLGNLQAITQRENVSKNRLQRFKKTSKYIGVSFDKNKPEQQKRWKAHIHYNKKSRSLGRYKTEDEAAAVYQNALHDLLTTGVFIRPFKKKGRPIKISHL